MRAVISILFFCLIFLSCRKDSCEKQKNIAPVCYEKISNPDWVRERFKWDYYTIEFPSDYTGGISFFEGNTFEKRSPDDKIFYEYRYCSPTFCVDFGDTLHDINISSITVSIRRNFMKNTILNKKIKYCNEENETGILFHNDSVGRFFMLDEGYFKEALDIVIIDRDYFNFPDAGEVLRTIERE
jgi:hypothetical protein